jgi:hypothetical protein
MKQFISIVLIAFGLNTQGQLPDGSIAPDFTLTDYYGTPRHLYSYLEEGKTVFVEIFAAHCPGCWAYHQTDRLQNIYEQYGPDGTDELMVLALEYDPYNDHNAFIGNHEPWVTQGNWLEGTPYPIFNVEDPHRWVFESYMVTFYPVIYKICPDRLTERVFTSQSEASLYAMVEECQANVSIPEHSADIGLQFDPRTRILSLNNQVARVEVIDMQGRIVQQADTPNQIQLEISQQPAGIYLIKAFTSSGLVTRKIYLDN